MSRKLILERKDEQTLRLSGLDVFLTRLLQEIPSAGEPGPACEGRFFPKPTGGQDARVDADWGQYVRPELEGLFSESRSRVAKDLEGIRPTGRGGYAVEIPEAHRWEWIHGLNQARLALATIHGLGEAELEKKVPLEPSASFAAFQIQFYALLQEWLLSDGPVEGQEYE
jgi:hypothetical protein